MDRSYYLSLRQDFAPQDIKLVVVAESPPVSGKYFYDTTGATTEHLFSALMRRVGFSPLSKAEGLRELQRLGWILIDATYEPVDKLVGPPRDQVLVRDFPLLVADLAAVTNNQTPIVLIKTNVCRVLEARLVAQGYNVINRGRIIYFPSHGRQKQFAQQFDEVLKDASI